MKEVKFEETIRYLEKIIKELEGGELSIEDSLEKYEEGMKLINARSKELDQMKTALTA